MCADVKMLGGKCFIKGWKLLAVNTQADEVAVNLDRIVWARNIVRTDVPSTIKSLVPGTDTDPWTEYRIIAGDGNTPNEGNVEDFFLYVEGSSELLG